MAELVAFAPVAATTLSVGASLYGGAQANKAAKSEAAQLDYQAGQQRAASQRQAEEQRRQARLANSRLQAVAGGGGGDVTAVNMSADLAGEGELRALTAIYEGEDRATGLEAQADSRRKAGKAARTAGYIGAVSSAFSGAKGMFEKFGGGGYGGMPDTVPTRGGR
jgi:hypothetical protein